MSETIGNLIGSPFPDFTAPTVLGDNTIDEGFTLSEYIKDSYALVFFYPLDFTFVCPSEILAHDHRLSEFEQRGVKVVGVSVDSHFTHLAWKKTPTEQGGLGQVNFPLVADLTKQIAKSFGVLLPDGVALRGSFLIDKAGKIRHYVINDLPLGRNVDESLRMVDALQFHEEHGEVCPAGWKKGGAGMQATPDGVAKFLSEHADAL
ncbi:peroxiredoxin [Roseospira marina]|uniref:Thioredoxin peroxidase n=1 Tax=Roseospira marina TaxID=140057 RepID=A0A5M6IC44_9PROT|nr:peroxiredoxin [Roseospira marina]KAA5605821.1 peroxiredoxin [Roseospira marina]MBB4313639.1 peroxiredoxin (alkyl hydroperoxide reductase subunit C) [Roseospira marina]MBB5086801.1 peroxiredoxin (alkyl hydroperoxide reductase subunit C) [Roseospira marina]